MIAVEANLRAESNGLRVHVDGRGSVVTCRLDGNVANMFTALRRSRHLLPALRALIPVLVRSGLRIDVVVGSRRVAHAGSDVQANGLARALRLPFVHLGA